MEVTDLLESIDLVELISQYVDLEEKNGEYWGISPFTYPPENTPSFSVRRESKSFYDFSSGIGGSAITFIERYMKITKHEAILWLEKYIGADDNGVSYKPKKKMAATMTCMKYNKVEQKRKESKSKVLQSNYMDRYERDLDKARIWINEGISVESLDKYQVRYDSFANQLVYPVRDVDGNIVNIGGRTLDPDWKEKGYRKYCYRFQWGTLATIYGLSDNIKHIIDKREIILFEGCKSVMKADTFGVHNTGAVLTSHLNPQQLDILIKLGCNVVFALDKDVNVREDHNIVTLKRFVNVFYIYDFEDLLDKKDSPVDKGRDVFLKLYERRLRYK